MNNFVYWVGIYSICVFTHEVLKTIEKQATKELEKKKESSQKRKEIHEIKSEPAHKPMNRIGF